MRRFAHIAALAALPAATVAPLIAPASLDSATQYVVFCDECDSLFLEAESNKTNLVANDSEAGQFVLVTPQFSAAANTAVFVGEDAKGDVVAKAEVGLVGGASNAIIAPETDKGLYRPGDDVRMRALAMEPRSRLALATGTAECEAVVSNPDGVRVARLSAAAKDGVCEFVFPTAREARTGVYPVALELKSTDSGEVLAEAKLDFELDNYVLPKFEVKLENYPEWLHQPAVREADSIPFKFDVTATYTYGEPVPVGKVLCDLSDERSGFVERLDAATEGSPQGMAKVDVSVPTEGLNGETQLKCDVTDASSGEVVSASAKIPYVWSETFATITAAGGATGEDTPRVLAGMPYELEASVTDPAGKPIVGKNMMIVASLEYENKYQVSKEIKLVSELSSNFVTSAKNYVRFNMPADNPECCDLKNKDTFSTSWSDRESRKSGSCCLTKASFTVRDTDGYIATAADGHASVCAERAPGDRHAQVTDWARGEVRVLSSFPVESAEFLVISRGSVVASGKATGVRAGDAAATFVVAGVPAPGAAWAPRAQLALKLQGADGRVLTAFSAADLGAQSDCVSSVSVDGADEAEALPGATVDLSLRAACGADQKTVASPTFFLTAVDRATELLGVSREEVSAASIGDALRSVFASTRLEVPAPVWGHACEHQVLDSVVKGDYVVGVSPSAAPSPDCPREMAQGNKCWYPGRNNIQHDGGMVMLEMVANEVDDFAGAPMQKSAGDSESGADGGGDAGVEVPAAKVRKFFPESWLWDRIGGDAEGQAVMSGVRVPDSITQFKLYSFAVSAASPVALVSADDDVGKVTVKKDVFALLTAPAMAIQGEEFNITVAVSNIGDSSAGAVTIELISGALVADEDAGDAAVSLRFLDTDVPSGASQQSDPQQLASGGFVSMSARVSAAKFGNNMLSVNVKQGDQLLDALQRPVRVRPAGVLKESPQAEFLQLTDAAGETSVEFASVAPEQATEGTPVAILGASGDLMGPSLQNLDGLVRLPTGCGEQNMIGLAPNVYAMQYSRATGALTDRREEMVRNIMVGYQRELTYRHDDGAFSAFGKNDESGSLWLSAFVVRVLSESAEFVSVDLEDLGRTARWIASKQDSATGRFPTVGVVLHQEMIGGVSTGGQGGHGFIQKGSTPAPTAPQFPPSLTAFAVIALVEYQRALAAAGAAKDSVVDAAITKAQTSLESVARDGNEGVYTRVLSVRAAQKGDLMSNAAAAQLLIAMSQGSSAIRKWEGKNKSSGIEATGYALMVLTEAGEIADALAASKHLAANRNGRGGFTSTQDTVVGLAALSKFSQAISAGDSDVLVEFTNSAGESVVSFDIGADPLLYRTFRAPANDTYKATVRGSKDGAAVVSVSTEYYILPNDDPKVPIYAVDVTWTPRGDGSGEIDVVACADADLGQNGAAFKSMSILEVGLFTGMTPLRASLEQLVTDGKIKRYDVTPESVALYVDGVGREQARRGQSEEVIGDCFEFVARETQAVEKRQPAVSAVYSYYDPEVMRAERALAYAEVGVRHIEAPVLASRGAVGVVAEGDDIVSGGKPGLGDRSSSAVGAAVLVAVVAVVAMYV